MEIKVTQIASATANAYLLKKGNIHALVDTLPKSAFRVLESVCRKEGVSLSDINYILLTHHHYDHVGNAKAVKDLSGAKVVCGVKDAPFVEGKTAPPGPSDLSLGGRILRLLPKSVFMKYQRFDPVEVDVKVNDGDAIDALGLEVISLPGHTAGGVCYLVKGRDAAFTGDIVSNFFGRCGFPFLSFSESVDEIMRSLKRLSVLGLDTAYPGHGKTIAPEASLKIGRLLKRKKK